MTILRFVHVHCYDLLCICIFHYFLCLTLLKCYLLVHHLNCLSAPDGSPKQIRASVASHVFDCYKMQFFSVDFKVRLAVPVWMSLDLIF